MRFEFFFSQYTLFFFPVISLFPFIYLYFGKKKFNYFIFLIF